MIRRLLRHPSMLVKLEKPRDPTYKTSLIKLIAVNIFTYSTVSFFNSSSRQQP